MASRCATGARCTRIALEALVPESLHLSQEMVQQIVRETHPKRELSPSEIIRLASMLNLALSDYEWREEYRSEPTFGQLRKQISDLHNALRKLKCLLPAPEQKSLRNYLIHLGEEYALTKGHPNLDPHTVSDWLPTTGEEFTVEVHYRSDEKLDQIVGDVTYLLDWMDHTPAHMKRPSNWWERNPHWLDDRSIEESLEYRFRSVDVHKLRSKVWLIGWDLPKIYHLNFGERFKISRPRRSGKYGPGVRFVLSVLKHVGMNVAPDTVIKYRTRAKEQARAGKARMDR
jgi:hypothetical protein